VAFFRQLIPRALRHCVVRYTRKESTRVPTGKNKHNYEIDDNRRIMELELPKNCGKVFKDQVAYFEKVLVTNNELLELSASIRQSKTKRIQDLEKTYKHLTHRFEEKVNLIRRLKEENKELVQTLEKYDHFVAQFTDLMNQELELLEHLKGRVIQFEKIYDVRSALEYIWAKVRICIMQ